MLFSKYCLLRVFLLSFVFTNLCTYNNLYANNKELNNTNIYDINLDFIKDENNLVSLETKNPLKTTEVKKYNHLEDYTHKHNKNKYLLTTGAVTVGVMFVGVGVLYSLPDSFTNWSKTDLSEDIKNLPSKWRENVREGPVWDKDDFFLNYVTHPYWGAVYYMQARNGGYGPFGSFMFSTMMSTFFWEYGVEAFAEVPSIQDLILTPVVGSLLGELFYFQSNRIKANNYRVLNSKFLGYTSLILMDPGFALIELTGLHKYVVDQEEPYVSYGATNSGLVISFNMKLKNKAYYSNNSY